MRRIAHADQGTRRKAYLRHPSSMVRRTEGRLPRAHQGAARSRALQETEAATEETKAKIRAAKLGRPLTPEHRAKLSAVRKGKSKSPAHRAAISRARRQRLDGVLLV